MNIKLPECLSRLLFSKPSEEQNIINPMFGILHYSRICNAWKGDISHLFLDEPNVKIYLPANEDDQLEWANDKFLQLKTRWENIFPEMVDSLYDYYKEEAFNPTSRYELPDKDRFREIIYLSCLCIFHSDQEQSLDEESPDYEVTFWIPVCGLHDGCMHIQITNWKLSEAFYYIR